MYHEYSIVIDHGVGAPGHEKYVVDDLNGSKKGFFTMLMTTMKLPGAVANNSHMVMHNKMSYTHFCRSMVFKKHFSEPTHANGFIDHRKDRSIYNSFCYAWPYVSC